jgi:hypothetical protein
MNRPTTSFGFAGWLGSGFPGRSTTHSFHNLGKPIAGIGETIEDILALTTAVNDSTVPQQSQVVAYSRQTDVKLVAQLADMTLPFGEQGDNLESGRVAEMLEQVRRPVHGHCTMHGLVRCLGRLRGPLDVKDRCRHRYLTPKGLDRLEVGRHIARSAGGLLGLEGI